MSNFIGGFLILLAGCGVVYFGFTLVRDIVLKVRERKSNKTMRGKK